MNETKNLPTTAQAITNIPSITDILAIQKIVNNNIWYVVVVNLDHKIVFTPNSEGIDSYKECVEYIQKALDIK